MIPAPSALLAEARRGGLFERVALALLAAAAAARRTRLSAYPPRCRVRCRPPIRPAAGSGTRCPACGQCWG